FAEKPEPSRSDCHAWSASPNYDFLATVCGIMPASPGFKSVNIEPHLGNLEFIGCQMPHPMGDITVKLKRKGEKGITGEIILPEGLSGRFIWDGKETDLTSGKQHVEQK
ncbi:MAG: alpha-L-rhamnosidase C-terminal domain-containing protein, partial [Bacteroidota bacterium]|nr:alpha-L-rhamnosidase C-terminal domain-containing protein [Bacteroidota bacterium]